MRPLYENDNNLRSEKNLISHVSDCWNVVSYKMPMSYKIDYAMYRDDILIGFAEVKCRTHKFGTFPTYIISLAKVMEARRLARETDTRSILIVSWTDKIGYLDFLCHHQIRHGGRADRNDWQDQEPVCHFDLKHFKGIGVRDEK